MKKVGQNIYLWAIIAVLLLVSLLPLTKISFITGDDIEYYITSDPAYWVDSARVYAESTGRFYFLLVKWIYAVPYLVNSNLYYYTMFIVPVITVFILFFWLIKRATNNSSIALLVALFSCATFSIFGEYSAMTSYPLYFTLSLISLFSSLHLLISYFKTSKYYFIIASASLFLITIVFYECYVFYSLLIFILIVWRAESLVITRKEKVLKIVKEVFPYIISVSIYLTIYVIYYTIHTSGYDGNKVASNLLLSKMLETLGALSLYSFPLLTFVKYNSFLQDHVMIINHSDNYFINIISQVESYTYLKGLIISIFWIVISQYIPNIYKKKKLLYVMLISILFIILPHLPLAITEKYTMYAPTTYITTSFAFFAVIIFLVTLYLLLLTTSSKQWIKRTVIATSSIIIFLITIMTQHINERVSDDMKYSNYRFDLMTNIFTKENIKDSASVFVAPLHETTSYSGWGVTRQSNPFRSYIKKQTGVSIHQYLDYERFYNTFKNSDEIVYLTYFSQAAKTGDAILILAPCKGKELSIDYCNNLSDSMLVGYLSVYKNFSISIVTDTSTNVCVSDSLFLGNGATHIANLSFDKESGVCQFKVKGEKLIPSKLMISNIQHYYCPTNK